MQQLLAFEAQAEVFKKQGFTLVAISPDTPDQLGAAQKFAKSKGGFPFPLVSAKSLDVFSRYRAYDDFEKMPLHAIALVDEHGLLRWLDVSYQPFQDAQFVLTEAQRLLSLDAAQIATTTTAAAAAQ
jgi:peroxiredoxin